MELKRQNTQELNLEELDEKVYAMKELLKEGETSLSFEQLCSFQAEDGSFALLSGAQIPREARIDYIYIPTYVGSAILMREYLKGNEAIEKSLIKGLEFTYKTKLLGHGYDAESTRVDSLRIFIASGLAEFLERKEEICPSFHHMIHNILHEYNANICNKKTKGAWGEDYKGRWKGIVQALKTEKRLYLAYGSNMNKNQMKERCQEANMVGTTYLQGWKLTIPFYANVEKDNSEKTPGVIWEISAQSEEVLDRYEGYPNKYNKKQVIVEVNGIETTAMIYVMTDEYKRINKKVRAEYVEGIIEGYTDAGFDAKGLY